MDELLVKYLAGEAAMPEQKLVEEWISASEANSHYFRHFQLIWDQSRQLAANTTVDENKAWQKFQRRIKKEEGRKQRPVLGWWKIAASVILLVAAGWLIRSIVQTDAKADQVVNVVSSNEVKKDTLPDGSVATLNKHSELSYHSAFKGQTRKVQLKGEAFFNVVPDKTKPFIIAVNDVQVKVVGTSFNIRSLEGTTEVTVKTGVVQVTKDGVMVELKAGEKTTLAEAGTAVQKQATNDKLYDYYVSKTFVCDNTPLWKLVEKLNEAYDVNIQIKRESLRKLPLTVTFDEESLDTILDIIRQTLMIKVSKKGNEIILH